jgi:hypothetical protein
MRWAVVADSKVASLHGLKSCFLEHQCWSEGAICLIYRKITDLAAQYESVSYLKDSGKQRHSANSPIRGPVDQEPGSWISAWLITVKPLKSTNMRNIRQVSMQNIQQFLALGTEAYGPDLKSHRTFEL